MDDDASRQLKKCIAYTADSGNLMSYVHTSFCKELDML